MSAKRYRAQSSEASTDDAIGKADTENGFIRSYYGSAGAGSIHGQLPVSKHRRQLLYAVENYAATIVVGEPGSGKSTQLPRYLYDAGWAENGKTIACTQPRRVAAAMLAQRVSEEMGTELGTTVGYSVRFANVGDPQLTRIKYLTDGALIRECLADPLLSGYSVVMVDEAQGRSIATDMLLALLKKIQRKRKNDLRIIVSSATLDAERFRDFFGKNESVILAIAGQQFPVDTQFLTAPSENYILAAVETVIKVHEQEPPGDILVFLPGKDDITSAISEVEEQIHHGRRALELLAPLPMHAGVTAEEQRAVFEPAAHGMRKAIFSTNVAETSVTIDGVVYVVDSGLAKHRVFDPTTGLDRLVTQPVSKSSAKQRAGRAGRTQAGKVFRLYTEEAFDSALFPQHDAPEVCRLSLAPMVLTLKALGVSNIVRFDYFQPPPPKLLSDALEMLVSLGAVDMETGSLTPDFGLQLAELPLDPPLGACLLNSVSRFNCAREAIAAVAMLALGETPFVVPGGKREEARQDKRDFMVREGDVLTFTNALLGFEETPQRVRAQWCHTHFLNHRLLDQASRISRQLESYLVRMGHRSSLSSASYSCGRDFVRLQKCLVSGFFANAAKLDHVDGRYKLVRSGVAVDVHPSSVYFSEKVRPDYVVFASAMDTTKTYIRGITAIEPEWLTELAPQYFLLEQKAVHPQ
ncbi:hypothetical protein GGF46_001238 [Coemansia sp. RSA 552]|nr:hypothetical protein GGF46_001238 [Coemansia sp. RSA 552]